MNKPSKMQRKLFALAHPDKVSQPRQARVQLLPMTDVSTRKVQNASISGQHMDPAQQRAFVDKHQEFLRDSFLNSEIPSNVVGERDFETEEAKAIKKGLRGYNCNRTACQKPHAWFLNNGTNKYYCLECAVDIGGYALSTQRDAMELYDNFDADMAALIASFPTLSPRTVIYLRQQCEWGKRLYATARETFKRNNPQAA